MGGSSGAALVGALKFIKDHDIGEGKRCVFICPDNIRNYISKFVNNDWLYEHGFMSEQECMESNIPKLVPHNVWGQDFQIKDLDLQESETVSSDATFREVINLMKNKNLKQLVVKCAKTKEFKGIIKQSELIFKLSKNKCTMTDTIEDSISDEFRQMSPQMPLSELARVFEKQTFVIVDKKFIVTNQDLLQFMQVKM